MKVLIDNVNNTIEIMSTGKYFHFGHYSQAFTTICRDILSPSQFARLVEDRGLVFNLSKKGEKALAEAVREHNPTIHT